MASSNGSRSETEDCLFVNVQRPAGLEREDGLPVYVFIHGGGLVTDNEHSPHLLADKMNAFVYVGGAENDQSFTGDQAEQLAKALTRLTDQVPPVAAAEVERIILEEYGAPADELFERSPAMATMAAFALAYSM